MCAHLDPEDGQARTNLDAALGVTAWVIPGSRTRRARVDVPTDAPAWWHGDEEASQTFLRSMGVS